MDTSLEPIKIVNLFDNDNNNNQDMEKLKSLLSVDMDNLVQASNGRTKFQIENLTALNPKESTNDYLKYQQVKLEYHNLIQNFINMLHEHNKAQADTLVAEAEIEKLINAKNLSNKMRQAKIVQQNVEIDRNKYQIFMIKKMANVKIKELAILKEYYDNLKYIDDLPPEQIAQMEEEGYKIKSAYFQELIDRYGLTPKGFIEYPHVKGGLNALLEVYESLPLKDNNKHEIKQLR